MSRLSVVVPVYNVEGYIDRCLGSLREQTLEDIEVICVNDGSTDGSAARLADWASRDGRIRIIDKTNGGLSSARNAGIDAASSPLVCFLDSDDRLVPNACEKIMAAFADGDPDVVTFGAVCTPAEKAAPWIAEALSPRDAFYPSFDQRILFEERSRPFAWRTACRRSFLRDQDIRFDEAVRFGEDQVFHFAVYPRAKGVRLLSDKLYEYEVARPGSLMDRLRDDLHQKLLEHVNIVDHILADWCEGGLLDLCPSQLLCFIADFALYDALKLSDFEYRDVAHALHEVLLTYWGREELGKVRLPKSVRKMLDDACLDGFMPSGKRKLLVLEYYTHLHGALGTAKKLISKV